VRDAGRLSTLSNGLRVLERLVDGDRTLRDLAAECGLPRQTTYRIVATLVAEGWAERDGAVYRASPRLWSLAAQSFSFDDLRATYSTVVRRLAEEHGESVHLAILDRDSVVYVDKADGSNPVGSYTTLGGRAPAYCVATGKVLLAHAGADALEAVIAGGLPRHTPHTLDEGGLRLELEEIRLRGHSSNRGEWREGVGGLAVPLWSPFDEVVAALGFSGPSERIFERQEVLLMALHEAVGTDVRGHAARRSQEQR
jgi:IclR family transcriptional regulator, KDG regulon repressor